MRAMKWIGLIGFVLCTSCAGLIRGPVDFAVDRWNDFLDCFTVQVGWGGPLPAVELHATHWVTTGAGFAVGEKWGIAGRKAVRRSYEQFGYGIPGGPHRLGWTSRKDFERDGALKWLYTYISCCNEGPPGTLFGPRTGVRVTKSIVLFDVTSIPKFAYHYDSLGANWGFGASGRGGGGGTVWEERKAIEALDVHVDVTAALLVGPSVRLGFSPGQFADFVLGFFGLDIAGDDESAKAAEPAKGGKQ